MNFSKRILLSLSIIACIPAQNNAFLDLAPKGIDKLSTWFTTAPIGSSYFDDLTPKDIAKFSAWFTATVPIGAYYFFHRPEDRPSNAPFERILEGRWDDAFNDIFNWENITNFKDVIRGQRSKIASSKFDGRSGAKITITDPDKMDIKGFGIPHFCEKNISKICKWLAASAALYALLYGKLDVTAEHLLPIAFGPYTFLPGKVAPAANNASVVEKV